MGFGQRAVHLLRASNDRAELIAAQAGYANGVTLRVLLRRKIGRGVNELHRSVDDCSSKYRNLLSVNEAV